MTEHANAARVLAAHAQRDQLLEKVGKDLRKMMPFDPWTSSGSKRALRLLS
jgi:hypothetical protein